MESVVVKFVKSCFKLASIIFQYKFHVSLLILNYYSVSYKMKPHIRMINELLFLSKASEWNELKLTDPGRSVSGF